MLAYILLLVTFLDEIIGSVWMPKTDGTAPQTAARTETQGIKTGEAKTQAGGDAVGKAEGERRPSLTDNV